MGGGSQTQSQSSSTQNSLPAWLTDAYKGALGNYQDFLNSGLSATASGPSLIGQGMGSVAGVNPQAIGSADSALSGILNGGFMMPGASQIAAANPMIGYEASGGLMNPSSNPYLGATFQQGANAVQNALDSQFAGAGRNVIGSAPVQADELNNLATNIYGGAYNTNLAATQNAQSLASGNYGSGVSQLLNAAGIAPGVTSGLYTPAQQQLSAGQTPYNLLSWYQSLLGNTAAPFGQSNSTGTGTVQNNPGGLATFGAIMSGLGALMGGIKGGMGGF